MNRIDDCILKKKLFATLLVSFNYCPGKVDLTLASWNFFLLFSVLIRFTRFTAKKYHQLFKGSDDEYRTLYNAQKHYSVLVEIIFLK